MRKINIKPKIICYFILFATSMSYAQNNTTTHSKSFTLQAEKTVLRYSDLDGTLNQYETLDLPLMESVHRFMKSSKGFQKNINLNIGKNKSWNLSLVPSQLISEDFQFHVLTDQGPIVAPLDKNIAFKGYANNNPENEVRMTITKEWMYGFVIINGEKHYIEPLSNLISGSKKGSHIIYKQSDVKHDPTLTCGNDEEQKYFSPPSKNRFAIPDDCEEVEFALAASFDMVSKYGTVADVADHMIGITNNVQALYDVFDLYYLIVDIVVPATAMADPWSTATCMDVLLPSFTAWGPGGFVNHDVGQLWVNRDVMRQESGMGMQPCTNSSLIGRAAGIGTVCTDNRYNCCEDWASTIAAAQAHLSAHELGHDWGGIHNNPSTGDIMDPSLNSGAPNSTWSDFNVGNITDHRDSRDCLTDCGTVCDVFFGGVVTQYSSECPDGEITSMTITAITTNGPLTYTIDGPVNQSNNTGVFNNIPKGVYDILVVDNTFFGGTCFVDWELDLSGPSDITPPDAVCQDITLYLDDSGLGSIFPFDVDGGSNDNCNIVVRSIDKAFFSCTDSGNNSVNFTVTDDSGLMSSCMATVNVQDSTPPMVVCQDITINLDDTGNTSIFPSDLDGGSTDNCSIVVRSINKAFFNCTDIGNNPVNFTVTDNSGNISSCVAMVTVEDNIPPIALCQDISVYLDALGMASITPADIDNGSSDICGITLELDKTQFSCDDLNENTVTLTVTDGGDNMATCMATVTVFDTVAPELIFCPMDTTINCDVPIDTLTLGGATYIDACTDNVTVTYRDEVVGLDGTCINQVLGTITRTFFGTDNEGNVDSSCVQVITIQDTIPPAITLVGGVLNGVENADTIRYQCFGQDINWGLPVMTTDNAVITEACEGEVEVTFEAEVEAEGNCPVDGFFRRFRCTWTATDGCDNITTLFIIAEIIDTIPPTLVGVPDDISVSCDDIPQPPFVESVDECISTDLQYQEKLLSDEDCAGHETIIRIWKAEDFCGNMTIDTQFIELIDNVAPIITITDPEISNIAHNGIREFDCSFGPLPAWVDDISKNSVSVIDGCSKINSLTFEHIRERGDCVANGYFERRILIWTAEDACGNKSIYQIELWLTDLQPPVFVKYDGDVCRTDSRDIEPFVYDECTSNYFLEYDDVIIGTSNCGDEIRRTYRAYDLCGNESFYTLTLHGEDNTPPDVIFRSPIIDRDEIEIECQAGAGDNISGLSKSDVIFKDKCDDDLMVRFKEEVISENSCSTEGYLYELLITWTAEDNCGNISQVQVTASVIDKTPPIVNFPDTSYYSCDDDIPKIIISDNCGLLDYNIEEAIEVGSCAGEEIRRYQIFGLDHCGNSIDKELIIFIQDNSGPKFQADHTVCDRNYTRIAVAYDVCMGDYVPAILISTTEESCDGINVVTRVYESTDDCGNTSQFIQRHFEGDVPDPELIVLDPRLPELFDIGVFQIASSSVWYDYILSIDGSEITSSSECILDNIFYDRSRTLLDDCRSDGTKEVFVFTWDVEGICGADQTMSFTVEVRDDIPPTVEEPQDLIIYCGTVPPVPTIQASDNFGGDLIRAYKSNTRITANGSIITRQWLFTDDCGNSSTVNQQITMIDDTGLSCAIVSQEPVIDCNSHNNRLNAIVSGSEGPYSYNWVVLEGGAFISSGQGTSQLQVYVGFFDLQIGLEVTDRFGCKSTCKFYIDCEENPDSFASDGISITSTLSNQAINVENIHVYPNPFTEEFTVKVTSNTEINGSIEVYDALGRQIYQSVTETPNITINAPWPSGVYMLRYIEGEYEKTISIVKTTN